MCSIGGEINLEENVILSKYHYEMIDTMKRRGPDDDGIYRSDNAVLLHARLAVIDPDGGKQPMTCLYGGKEYTVVYNGELYNTDTLRDKLMEKGLSFKTSSETEEVLIQFSVL